MLIPTVIALSQFFIDNFPKVGWYPYWYLGNPYHLLIGPVVPLLLLFLKRLLHFHQTISFDYAILFGCSLIATCSGIYWFVSGLTRQKLPAIISVILYFILPGYWYVLQFQNGLDHIGFSLVPYLCIIYKRCLEKGSTRAFFFLAIGSGFLLLINVSLVLIVWILFASMYVSYIPKEKREELILKTVLAIILGIGFATLWYTPGFWLILLANPSLGGIALFQVITGFSENIFAFIPAICAIIVVKWREYKPQPFLFFLTVFLACLLFLTLSRFLFSPTFIMDWTGFGVDIQFGLAILLAIAFARVWNHAIAKILFGMVFLVSVLYNSLFVRDFLYQPQQKTYQKEVSTLLQTYLKPTDRLFTSGTPVFWLNSNAPMQQVRGGVDTNAQNPLWAMAAYQIRDGKDADITKSWLQILGVSYILVNGIDSLEPFHDFKHPEKFEQFQLLDTQEGNSLYHVLESSIGRLAIKKILSMQKPKSGIDRQALTTYTQTFQKPIIVNFLSANKMRVTATILPNTVISLSETYDNGWHIKSHNGSIVSDNFGNMVIVAKNIGTQEFYLEYQAKSFYQIITIAWILITAYVLFNFTSVYYRLKKKMPALHIGLSDEDE